MVAKITKKIGEWSVRETARENAVLTQDNLKEKTEENRGLTAEENRGLFPSGSERPELHPEVFSDVDILERPDKRRKAEKIKKLGGTPKQRREQIRATLLPSYMSESLERLGCVFCTSSVPAGWSLVWTTSRPHITAPLPLLLKPFQGLQVVRLKGDHKGIG